MQLKVESPIFRGLELCREREMLIGFIILGSIGGAIGALAALLLGASPLLVVLSYSLTGTLSALIVSLIFVIASEGRPQQNGRAIVKQSY